MLFSMAETWELNLCIISFKHYAWPSIIYIITWSLSLELPLTPLLMINQTLSTTTFLYTPLLRAWYRERTTPYKHQNEPPCILNFHDDVIKWKYFPHYWPFMRGINQSPVNFPHKGQWRGALMFSLICAWINGWVYNRKAGDLRCNRTHYDVTVVLILWLCSLGHECLEKTH